jgi:hypothetical protein
VSREERREAARKKREHMKLVMMIAMQGAFNESMKKGENASTCLRLACEKAESLAIAMIRERPQEAEMVRSAVRELSTELNHEFEEGRRERDGTRELEGG